MRIIDFSNMESINMTVSANNSVPDKCIFPMPDAKYVRAAEAFFSYASEECKPCLAYKILLKAQEFDVIVKNPMIYLWAEKFLK